MTVHPFRSSAAWLLASRYRHILKALEHHPAPDTLVQERLGSLARWSRTRAVVAGLLYLGIAAWLATFIGSIVPAISNATQALVDFATVTGAFAGVLTLAFLFLTRLLSQIEADILMLLIIRK